MANLTKKQRGGKKAWATRLKRQQETKAEILPRMPEKCRILVSCNSIVAKGLHELFIAVGVNYQDVEI